MPDAGTFWFCLNKKKKRTNTIFIFFEEIIPWDFSEKLIPGQKGL